ncbi:hypothetical protein GCM10009721_25270 [Terrabacter tumescens]|uniref:Uncharacterized protein n=1 Tax=Terrabacter tumescens TaxID=60443 RepID=A0ABQ2I2V4_9MICO|nr:hypothetical protein GCM10009721_25270 [Terrabacter tumescens]
MTDAPSATYLAVVAAPLLDSSSGCACTAIKRMPSATWLPVRLQCRWGGCGWLVVLIVLVVPPGARVGAAPAASWETLDPLSILSLPRAPPCTGSNRQDLVCRPARPCPAPPPAS